MIIEIEIKAGPNHHEAFGVKEIDKNITNVANFQNQDYVLTKSSYSNRT